MQRIDAEPPFKEATELIGEALCRAVYDYADGDKIMLVDPNKMESEIKKGAYMTDEEKYLRLARWQAACGYSCVEAAQYPDENTKMAYLDTAKNYLIIIKMCNKGLGEDLEDLNEILKGC